MTTDRRSFFSKLFAPVAAFAVSGLPALAASHDDGSYVITIPEVNCQRCQMMLIQMPTMPGAQFVEVEHPAFNGCKNSGRKWNINLTPWKAERTK